MGRYNTTLPSLNTIQENSASFEEEYNSQAIDENMSLSEEGWKELNESYYCNELCHLTQGRIEQFLESTECQLMLEKSLIGKKTMIKLSKMDDLERRIGMAAIQLAKEHNDPLYEKLKLNRIKERQLLGAINKRYVNPASKVAKVQQKEHIQNKIPIGYARP